MFLMKGMLFVVALCLSSILPFVTSTISIDVSETGGSSVELKFAGSRRIHLAEGIGYTIKCSLVGSEEFVNTPWTHDGSAVSTDTAQSVYQYGMNHIRNLIFSSFAADQSGSYTCSTTKKSKTLVISSGNPSMIISETSFIKVDGESSPITIKLLWSGNPTPSPSDMMWYFNGQEITDNLIASLSLYWNFDDPLRLLTFQGLSGYTKEIEGTYRCNVTSSAGTGSDALFLDVLFRPSTTINSSCNCIEDQTIVQAIGSTLTLSCIETHADPVRTFTWYRDREDGPLINDSSIIINSVSSEESQLTFISIQPRHMGTYVCKANNTIGKDVQAVTLLRSGELIITCGNYTCPYDTVTYNCAVIGATALMWSISVNATTENVTLNTHHISETENGLLHATLIESGHKLTSTASVMATEWLLNATVECSGQLPNQADVGNGTCSLTVPAYTAPINVSVTVLGPQMVLVQWSPPTTWTHCITGYSVVSNYSSIITNATNITLHNLPTNTTISVAGVDSGNRLTPKANITVLYSVLYSHTPSSSSSIGVSTSHADIPTTMDPDVTSLTRGTSQPSPSNNGPTHSVSLNTALYVAAGIGGGIGGAIAVIVIYTIVLPVVCICACKKLRLKSVNLTTSTTDTQSNAAYGYVGGGKMPSVSAEYETITTTVDVQSNDVSGKILSTAVYDTVTTDS